VIARLRSICTWRSGRLLLLAALLASALAALLAGPGKERRPSAPSAVVRAIESQGVELAPLPPSGTDPDIRGAVRQRFAIGPAAAGSAQRDTVTIYVFPTESERSKDEGALRMAAADGGTLPPLVFENRNVLVLYRPLAVVNQTGTKYGDLLRRALDSL
jgi:hypothetical protein